MVGLERSVLPLVGERDFGLDSKRAILSFVVAFGIAKALSNLVAGGLADRVGRKRLLVLGWLLALPVPLLIALAPELGLDRRRQPLPRRQPRTCLVDDRLMKIDLVGPRATGARARPERVGRLPRRRAGSLRNRSARRARSRPDRRLGRRPDRVAVGIGRLGRCSSATPPRTSRSSSAHTATAARGRSGTRSPTARSRTRCCAPAHRQGSSTTSTTRSPGASPRSTSPPMAPASPRSESSRRSTPPSGAPASC